MKVLEMSDGTLLDGLRRGDERAFEAIFNRHWGAVYGVLYRLVGTREEAEDLAQEVFLKLHQRPLAKAREHNLPGWLYRVATNLGYNALRASRRRQARQERFAGSDVKPDHAPVEAALAAEEREVVRQVLATMPPRQRDCLVLRHQGLSYVEVAAALEVAPSSVGTLLARAEVEFRRRYLTQRGGL